MANEAKTVVVEVTIPAGLVTKENDAAGAREMRHIIDRAFNVAIGRCTWNAPIKIIGTTEQWAIFCYLMCEKNLRHAFKDIGVAMYLPANVDKPTVFDAREKKSNNLLLRVRPVPEETPSTVS